MPRAPEVGDWRWCQFFSCSYLLARQFCAFGRLPFLPGLPPFSHWGSSVRTAVAPLPLVLSWRQALRKLGQVEYGLCSVHLVTSGMEMDSLMSFFIINFFIFWQ